MDEDATNPNGHVHHENSDETERWLDRRTYPA